MSAPGPLVLVPLGSIEAHGPHLPLETDTHIALHLARRVARAWVEREDSGAVVAPPIERTACSFAADFPGTRSADPAEERRAIDEAVRDARLTPKTRVVLVNLHFDPEHMRVVRDAVSPTPPTGESPARFVDFTRRAHAQRIGGEFATGACHAGEFETSLMLVAAPQLVQPLYRKLPPIAVNLAEAIQTGKRTFREVGMPRAYCGHPAAATVQEGERLYRVLGEIVLEACLPP